ncbi:hypothetical protein BDN72DRAFT_279903 [Pluteus cervinus]|uniref:Uncharacterized protein n=1 Tax=Pluteus cervinus TaxID=181527 RepID=A0ACD3AFB3_9AGAR|nr:hypothetical protein BDN72DRAFT_279903 [Pluteus cervinus]
MLSTIVSGSLSSSLARSGVLSVIMVVLCALLIVIQLAQIDVAARVLEFIVKAFDSDAAAAVDTCLFIKFLVSISLLSTFHSTHVGVLVSKIVDIHQKISQCSRGVGPSGNGSAGRTSSNSRGNGNKRSKGSKDDGSAPPPPPPPPPSRPPPPPKNGKDANEINKAIVTVFVHVKAVLGHLKQVYKLSRPTKTRSRMEVNHLMLLWLYELRFETHKVAKAVGLSVNHKREPKYLFDYGIGEMYGLLEKILKYEDLVKRDICRCGSARDVEMMERRFEEEVVYRPIQELRDAVTLMMGCLKVMQEDREKGKRAKESEKVKPEVCLITDIYLSFTVLPLRLSLLSRRCPKKSRPWHLCERRPHS